MASLLIVNPAAGRRRAARVEAEVAARVAHHWRAHDVRRTSAPGEAIELARRGAEEGFDPILVLGGDGTVHEAANGLLAASAKPSLGVIPIGTGNDFARATGVGGVAPRHAVDRLARATRVLLDVARAWDEFSVNSIGLGLDAEVAFAVSRLGFLSGMPAYGLGLLQTLWRFRPQSMTVTWDGGTLTDSLLAVEVGNGATTGGGFRLTPDASPTDGLLDVCCIRAMSPLAIMRKLPKAITGNHTTLPEVTMARTAALTITGHARPLRAHFDGEGRDRGADRIDISIQPARLPVLMYTPAES